MPKKDLSVQMLLNTIYNVIIRNKLIDCAQAQVDIKFVGGKQADRQQRTKEGKKVRRDNEGWQEGGMRKSQVAQSPIWLKSNKGGNRKGEMGGVQH